MSCTLMRVEHIYREHQQERTKAHACDCLPLTVKAHMGNTTWAAGFMYRVCYPHSPHPRLGMGSTGENKSGTEPSRALCKTGE